jgi:hypothetical protein
LSQEVSSPGTDVGTGNGIGIGIIIDFGVGSGTSSGIDIGSGSAGRDPVIGLRVAAKLLNVPASELALSVAAIRRRFARANEILSLSICTNGFTT